MHSALTIMQGDSFPSLALNDNPSPPCGLVTPLLATEDAWTVAFAPQEPFQACHAFGPPIYSPSHTLIATSMLICTLTLYAVYTAEKKSIPKALLYETYPHLNQVVQ